MWNQLGSFRDGLLLREEVAAGQGWSFARVFCRGTVQLHSRWGNDDPRLCPPPPPDWNPCPPTQKKCPLMAAVLCCWDGRVEHRRYGTSQRSSERFWIASATAVRSWVMTERGSSLPMTALPDTIMLAPAWGKYIQSVSKQNHTDDRWVFTWFDSLTSAHLWMVSGPTPPSTSMSNEGNWLLNQLTWKTPVQKRREH